MEGQDTITLFGKYKIGVYSLETICILLCVLIFLSLELLPFEFGEYAIILFSLSLFFLGCSIYLWNISRMNKVTKSDYYVAIGLVMMIAIVTLFVSFLILSGDLGNSPWFWYLMFFIWFIVIMESYPNIKKYKEN
jgi:hypothetical protein